MTIEALVARYGLAALFVGAGVEGETVVVAGGLLAHQGLLPLPGVMAAAGAGAFLADQGWFLVGRRLRYRRWVSKMRANAAFAKALAALERHPIGFIFVFRYLYGLRTVSPIAIGTSEVRGMTFLVVNAVAAAIWSVVFSAIGYLFGGTFERLVGRLHPHGGRLWWIVGGLAALALAAAAIRWWRTRGS